MTDLSLSTVRSKLARLGTAKSLLLEAAEEVGRGDEPDLASEITDTLRKVNVRHAELREDLP